MIHVQVTLQGLKSRVSHLTPYVPTESVVWCIVSDSYYQYKYHNYQMYVSNSIFYLSFSNKKTGSRNAIKADGIPGTTIGHIFGKAHN